MSERSQTDRASGGPVALEEKLQALARIIQITISDHQGVGALGEADG